MKCFGFSSQKKFKKTKLQKAICNNFEKLTDFQDKLIICNKTTRLRDCSNFDGKH